LSQLIFGKYEIIRRIAIGGMGEVFLARQSGGVDRLVILKNLLPELAEQEGFIDQFLDEARVAATLNHPNIVSIFEVGAWEGIYYIAMEYINGENLNRLAQEGNKASKGMPAPVVAQIIAEAALGLDHAHHAKTVAGEALNIVHRDISPHNIMVRGDGVTKVVDFGIAKAANKSTRTQTGVLKGKLHYMAPEQASGGEVDGRSDQFALGVCLWELLTGERLFKGDNEIQTINKVLACEVVPPSTVVPDLPTELEAITLRMLKKDPAERFPRCGDVAKSLKHYIDNVPKTVFDVVNEEGGGNIVSEYVESVMGEELVSRVSDLTPSASNFMINLSGDAASGQTVNFDYGFEEEPAKPWLPVALGAALIVLLGGLGGGAYWFSTQNKPKPAQAQVTNEIYIKGPKGATIYVDDKKWPSKAPTILKNLGIGEHNIRLVLAGKKPVTRKVNVKNGTNLLIDPEAQANPITVSITTTPPGATVLVGLSSLGTTPVTIDSLKAGVAHTLSVEKRGYKRQEVKVNLEPGEKKEFKLTLEKRKYKKPTSTQGGGERVIVQEKIVEKVVEKVVEKQAATKAMGGLTLKTAPWTRVFVDGEDYGSTPLFKLKLKAGKRKLRLVNEAAGVDHKRVITVKPGKTVKLNLNLKK